MPMSQLLLRQEQYENYGIYEHVGPNRSGKTMLSAIEAWVAYNRGLQVYCNCSENPFTGKTEHILNFPHTDYVPGDLMQMGLRGVYVMTDQAEQFMDATAPTKAVRQMGYFNYQAKKRWIAWHYDTVRHKNIYNRVRLNPDWIIYTRRYPHDWRKPLVAIRLEITQDENTRVRWILNPERFFPLYNDVAMVRPEEE
jgi:hypothetical protein